MCWLCFPRQEELSAKAGMRHPTLLQRDMSDKVALLGVGQEMGRRFS